MEDEKMNKFGINRSNRWRGKELTRVLNFGRNDEKANKFHKNYEKKLIDDFRI